MPGPISGGGITAAQLAGGTLPIAGTTLTLSGDITLTSSLSLRANDSQIYLQTDGTISFSKFGVAERWQVSPSGHFLAGANNIYDIGAGGNAPRNVIIGLNSAKVGGVIFDHFTDGASTSTDGTEDTLYTDTLAASGLSANGQKLSGFYQIAIVGHAVSTDRIRLYFAGTAIFDTAAINFPVSSQLTIIFEVIRVSSTVVRASVSATTTTATLLPYSQYTEITSLDLTATQILALKDISTGTNSAAGDVTAKLASILWLPAA